MITSRSLAKLATLELRHPSRVAAALLCVVLLLYVRNVLVGCGSQRVLRVDPPASVLPVVQQGEAPAAALDRWLVENKLAGRNVVTEKKLKVAVVNSVSWHNEVVFWLVYTLRLIPNLDLSLYLFWKKYGSDKFLTKIDSTASFKQYYMPSFKAKGSANQNPDVIFLTTCGNDISNIEAPLMEMLKLNPKLKLICIVHHPEVILNDTERLLPFAKTKSLTFMSLAPHVASFVVSDIIPELVQHSVLFANVPSLSSPATFLYEPKAPCPRAMSEMYASFPQVTSCFSDFVIQGMVEYTRRNYSRIFEGVNEKLNNNSGSWDTFHLNLMGASAGNLTFPKPVDEKLRFFNGLSYDQFYELMHHNAALLPAFASSDYYLNVSSSSVAAALIANVPVLADRRFLEAYSFFEEDAIYLQNEGETEADAIERIRGSSMEEVVEKRRKLFALNVKLIAKNVQLFRSIIREGLRTG